MQLKVAKEQQKAIPMATAAGPGSSECHQTLGTGDVEELQMCPDAAEAATAPGTAVLPHPSFPGSLEEEKLLKEAFSCGYPQVGH